MGKSKEADDGSGNVNAELDDIRPDHSSHAAFKGVDQGQGHDDSDGQDFAGAQSDLYDNSNGPYAHAFSGGTRSKKDTGRNFMKRFAEAAIYKLIRGEHFAPKILRNKEQADDDASGEVAEHQLKEAKISPVGDARCADKGQCAGFRGNDRKTYGPPGNGTVSKEIIAQGALRLSEP